MKKNEKIGVWMDHSQAQIIPYSQEKKNWITIMRENDHAEHEIFGAGDKRIRNKSRRQQVDFYNAIKKVILDYPDVLLFGPTDAKQELHNLILKNPQSNEIKIAVKSAGQMSENQMHAYVVNHFKPIAFGLLS